MNGISVVVMVVVGVSLTQRAQSFFSANPVDVIPAANALTMADTNADLNVLLGAQLFGKVETEQQIPSDQITLTSLNIKLIGVIVTAVKEGGIALLSIDGKPEEAFLVGREIVAGATLLEVRSDRIILGRGAQREMVLLPGAEESLLATMWVPVADSAIPSPHTSSPAIINAVGNAAVNGKTKNTFVVARGDISKQVKTPQELLSQAVMVPNNGGGFLLKEIQPGSLIEQFGLRPGDIVRSANGRALNYADDIRQVYQQLSDARQLKLVLLRDGKPEELNYQIR